MIPLHTVTLAGGDFPMLMRVVLSPLFGLGLIAFGVSYGVFVEKSPIKHHWIFSYIGWTVTSICGILMVSVFLFNQFLYDTNIVGEIHELTRERHVNDDQRAKLKQSLSALLSNFPLPITVQSADNPEANGFSIELMDALTKSGLKVQTINQKMIVPIPMRALSTKVRGVFFQVRDKTNPPNEVRVLIWVLASADIKATIWPNPDLGPTNYILTIGLK